MKFILLLICVTASVQGWVKEMENDGLYQGDIILSPDEMKEAKEGKFSFSSLKDLNTRWPNAIVPYMIDSSLTSHQKAEDAINAAIADYHKYTCLRFRRRDQNDRSYIRFYLGGGCSSRVGYRRNTVNSVSLSNGCWSKHTALHEIGHSLGLHHEQTRPDRDTYVTIDYANIHQNVAYNFHKEKTENINSYSTPYDYLSMMHYGWNAFAVDSKRATIITKDRDYQYHIGQGEGFSRIDVKQLNLMYNCKGSYPEPPEYKIVKDCYDLMGGCAGLAANGACSQSQWQTHVQTNCRRSCNFCGDGGSTNSPPTRPPIRRTTKATTKGTSSGVCRDSSDCSSIDVSECGGRYKDFYLTNCKKSCNFCGTSTGGSCKDTSINCDRYKDKCNDYKIFKTTCRRTCKFC